ncbi:hypothetical protein TSUD_137230 [Trifolium subterraneum]|uniref:Uncharacterized protein n=1 Tax=Trifolium subterraneum TaxID=3900 RepID=A0A2Z6PH88_TRISU|nr:hypothetical protein TSUD_137230 [Trifolium subterraneum]
MIETDSEEDTPEESQPLSQALWDTQVPPNFKIPHLPTFDGKTDPLEHLMAVGTQTSIIGAEEHLKCKLLSGTLKDAALRWYMNLPRNSNDQSVQSESRDEVMKRAECYIKGEESNAEKRDRDSNERASDRRSPDRRESSRQRSHHVRNSDTPYQHPWYSNERNRLLEEDLTPLNSKRVQVLDEILSAGLARLPQAPDRNIKMGPNSDEWCHYHRCKGHDTEKCFRLKELIEKLISSRHLRKFIEQAAQGAISKRTPPHSPGNTTGDEKDKDQPRVVVNTIAASPTPEISFSASDGEGIFPHDDDPLVIQVQILNYDVKRVLIDSGSSADIMYWEAFKAMQLAGEQLQIFATTEIGENSHQLTNLGTNLGEEEKREIIAILKENADLFAWKSSDMPGIDESIITHKLTISPSAKPVCQRKRKVGEERRLAIDEEVAKLREADFIEEVKYPDWLANIVMVKKQNGKWRMCVDFTDLNKACPKDPYPLPSIDRLIDGASSYKTLSFMDSFSRMVAWAIELSEHDISFVPRGNIKSQVLADFILESSSPPEETTEQPWTLSVDGASNLRGSGAGVVLEGPDGVMIEQSLRFAFKTRNNQAEYEALIPGMRLAKEMGVASLEAKSDSQLVTSQVSGDFQAKDPQLIKYLEQVKRLSKNFATFDLVYVPREQNARADLLSKLASTKKPENNRTMIQETISKPSTGDQETFVIVEREDWRNSIILYLQHGEELEGKEEAKLKKMAAYYTIIEDRLYKRGFSFPMLLCVGEAEYRHIIDEIHSSSCGSHIGTRSLAGKVTRAGFFLPTLLRDANSCVRSCDKCQRHADLHHAPGEPLKSVMSPWPFYMWGVDILGPFTTSQNQAKFLLVAVDYFTKWIEAEPVATISSDKVKKFYLKNLICRFGLPQYIVSR